ncbi:hypothetical protein [Archangium sp.]|uniref:hypothetical protein n=1 Tax=Archangium sp. TaxID=1872627 RepID=UPI003899D5D5
MAALRLGHCDDGLRTLRHALSVAGARASTQPEVLRVLGDRLARYERTCEEFGRTPPAK